MPRLLTLLLLLFVARAQVIDANLTPAARQSDEAIGKALVSSFEECNAKLNEVFKKNHSDVIGFMLISLPLVDVVAFVLFDGTARAGLECAKALRLHSGSGSGG